MPLKGLNNPDHVMDTEKMDKKMQCSVVVKTSDYFSLFYFYLSLLQDAAVCVTEVRYY